MNCLLLTSDITLLQVVRASMSAADVELEMRTDATSAIELSARRRLDSFVIDCDDVAHATDLLSQIRKTHSNKLSVIFAVVNARTSAGMVLEAGANFVLGKPVRDKQMQSFLEIARPRMEREHRRYFRHKVDLPVELSCPNGEIFAGKMLNVSAGGLALTRFGPTSIEGVVTVCFVLPSVARQVIQAKADVAWKDNFAVGLRFLQVDPSCRSLFEAWLNSLEAQKQFQESTTST